VFVEFTIVGDMSPALSIGADTTVGLEAIIVGLTSDGTVVVVITGLVVTPYPPLLA